MSNLQTIHPLFDACSISARGNGVGGNRVVRSAWFEEGVTPRTTCPFTHRRLRWRLTSAQSPSHRSDVKPVSDAVWSGEVGPKREAQLNWGVLGTGVIARVFSKALAQLGDGRLYGVATRNQSRILNADDFFGAKFFRSYEELLADRVVDAVYIATPHPTHFRWGLAALNSGKHVLCEKPMTTSASDAVALSQTARKNRRLLAEAFMYRHNPVIAALAKILRSRAI